ncbi:MAG: hypothetical protein NXI24_21135 [bacterium]|nr:hypothetical protein [bacterium]
MFDPQRRGIRYYCWFALGMLCGAALFVLAAASDPGAPFRFIYEAF